MNSELVARKLLPYLGILAFCFAAAALGQVQATQTTPGAAPDAAEPNMSTGNVLHVGLTPYLWFAGMNGTAGALGRETGVNASFGDIFKYLNIGLMAELEARKGRVPLATDILWMKLSDDKALPVNEPGITSIKFKVDEFLLTPEVGYRVIDNEKVKVEAVAGIRYWHLSQNLGFTPELASGISRSQDWVDGVGEPGFTFPYRKRPW